MKATSSAGAVAGSSVRAVQVQPGTVHQPLASSQSWL